MGRPSPIYWNFVRPTQIRDPLSIADGTIVWISGTTYILVLGTIKASLCLLYAKIFPDRRRRAVTFTIMGFIIVSDIILFLVFVNLCSPIRGYWHIDIGAKCMNMTAIGYAVSSFAIVQDVVLLVWPLICLLNLDMARQRKLAVALMLAVGTL